MAQPTTINYPVSYEDADSLVGDIQDREIYTLSDSVNTTSLNIKFNESLAGLNLPAYLVFAGGEIIWVEEGEVTGTEIDLTSLEQRGVAGSEAQVHSTNEEVYNTFLEKHHEQYKNAIIAAQENGFLMGLESAKPGTCSAGEAYYETDTKKVYFCFSTDAWTQIVPWGDHSQLSNLDADDHTNLHTDGRADTWHGLESGVHMVNDDDHDHTSASEGNAIQVIKGGSSLPGSPSYAGQIYFDRTGDSGAGILYISYDGIVWASLSGVPSGGIAMFAGACPSGWSRYTDLDGKYAMADDGVVVGGANTHAHDYDEQLEHYHVVAGSSPAIASGGNHKHTIPSTNESAGPYSQHVAASGSSGLTTSFSGAHTHDWDIATIDTNSTGDVDGTITTEDGQPSYKETVFCQKD